jgi:hypothetical protein
MAFIINNSIKAKVNLSINNHFILATIGDTTLIGVHLPYYTGLESSFNLEAILTSIGNLIVEERTKSRHCIVMGDFNVDFTRDNTHTIALKEFINNYELTVGDLEFKQNITYTLENHTGKHWIDHMMVTARNKMTNVSILDSINNHSDHRAIRMSFIINNSAEGYSYKSINKIKKLNLQYNWYNAEFIKNYSDRIDKGLEECETILTSDFHEKKIIATRALTVICKTLCKSAEKAFHEINNKKKRQEKSQDTTQKEKLVGQ